MKYILQEITKIEVFEEAIAFSCFSIVESLSQEIEHFSLLKKKKKEKRKAPNSGTSMS